MGKVSIDPNRYIKRNVTKLKHKWYRLYTSFTKRNGSIYLIEDKMYQVWDGRYTLIGEVDKLVCDGDLNTIPNSAITNP